MAQDDPIGQFIALPQDQQIAILQRLSPDKQTKLLGQVKERRTPENTKLTRPVSDTFYKKHPILGRLSDFGGGAIAGAENLILHPLSTIQSMGEATFAGGSTPYGTPMIAPTGNKEIDTANQNAQEAAQASQAQQGREMAKHPFYTAGNIAGMSLAGEGAGGAAEGVRRIVPPAFRSGLETLTGTSPKAVRELVKDTQKANAARNETADIANKEAAQEHLEKTRDALHETEGRELQHQQATKEAEAANARAAHEHEQAVQVVDAANNAKLTEHGEKTRSVERENAQRQADYEAEKEKVSEIEKAAKEQGTKRGELARKIRQQSARLVDRLKTVQEKWKDSTALQKTKGYKPTGILDVMYDNLRKATAGQTVPIEMAADAVRRAQSKLKGSAESVKQFNDILAKEKEGNADDFVYQGGQKFGPGTALYESVKETPEGLPGKEPVEPLTFSDLQGYYTEIGSKLAPGNLLPDVYLALRSLQEDIGGMMKDMATKAGVPSLYTRAQAAYRDYMQTFRDSTGPNHSGSPIAQSLQAKDPAYAINPLTAEETAQRVRNALARFDPGQSGQGGAASLYDNFRASNREFDALGKPINVPVAPNPPEVKEPPSAPTLAARPTAPKPVAVEPPERVAPPDRPIQVQPEVKRIGAEDVKAAKKESMEGTAKRVQHRIAWATFTPTLIAIEQLVRLHGITPGEVGAATMGTIGMAGFNSLVGKLFANPSFVEFMTRATPGDIAEIPPELRTGFPAIVKAAQAKGIRVSPVLIAVTAASGAQPPKHPVLSSQSPVQPVR